MYIYIYYIHVEYYSVYIYYICRNIVRNKFAPPQKCSEPLLSEVGCTPNQFTMPIGLPGRTEVWFRSLSDWVSNDVSHTTNAVQSVFCGAGSASFQVPERTLLSTRDDVAPGLDPTSTQAPNPAAPWPLLLKVPVSGTAAVAHAHHALLCLSRR